jgi:hypothetical protein
VADPWVIFTRARKETIASVLFPLSWGAGMDPALGEKHENENNA